jgi:hypothetical protein
VEQLQFALMPWQILGNQPFDIRIDRESAGIEGGRSQHEQRAGNDNHPPIAGAEINDSHDRWIYRHGRWWFSICCAGGTRAGNSRAVIPSVVTAQPSRRAERFAHRPVLDATRAVKTSRIICSVRRFCRTSIFIALKIPVHGLLTPLQSMFGIQVQPVTALHRDAVVRGPPSIFAARDHAVLAPHG